MSGSPDLAATIFEKIEKAAVFVADVTLVGETLAGKKLINSNVAIEYGHAHRALTDRSILMIQNTHYGDREALPSGRPHSVFPRARLHEVANSCRNGKAKAGSGCGVAALPQAADAGSSCA